MGTTSSITMQNLGKIAGCRCENVVFVFCLFFFTGRMPRSGKLPVLNLLTGQKSGFSPRRATRCTDSSQTWQGRRAHGSAWLCKISPQSPEAGGNAAPKYQKFHFLVKSRPAGLPISKFFRDFYMPNYRTLVFQISYDSHHRLRSNCCETARP